MSVYPILSCLYDLGSEMPIYIYDFVGHEYQHYMQIPQYSPSLPQQPLTSWVPGAAFGQHDILATDSHIRNLFENWHE